MCVGFRWCWALAAVSTDLENHFGLFKVLAFYPLVICRKSRWFWSAFWGSYFLCKLIAPWYFLSRNHYFSSKSESYFILLALAHSKLLVVTSANIICQDLEWLTVRVKTRVRQLACVQLVFKLLLEADQLTAPSSVSELLVLLLNNVVWYSWTQQIVETWLAAFALLYSWVAVVSIIFVERSHQ